MIKLERAQRPDRLDDATVAKLTAEYVDSGPPAWNIDFIKKPLLASTHGKCSYCEARLDEESKYMEVEHVKNKRDFPDEVVLWNNLLPSCKKCNGNKGVYNVVTEGAIFNPFDIDPRGHIYLETYRIRWRDYIGGRTVEVIYLNDTERLVRVRFDIGEGIAKSLETNRGKLEDYIACDQTVRRRNAITYGVRDLLKEAQPDAQFSAVSATVLLCDPNYSWIKERLIELGIWDELDGMEASAITLGLAR